MMGVKGPGLKVTDTLPRRCWTSSQTKLKRFLADPLLRSLQLLKVNENLLSQMPRRLFGEQSRASLLPTESIFPLCPGVGLNYEEIRTVIFMIQTMLPNKRASHSPVSGKAAHHITLWAATSLEVAACLMVWSEASCSFSGQSLPKRSWFPGEHLFISRQCGGGGDREGFEGSLSFSFLLLYICLIPPITCLYEF